MDERLSPLQTTTGSKSVSRKQFEEIKRMLGVESLLIVADEHKHICDPSICMGHWFYFRSDGFTSEQLGGVAQALSQGSDEIAKSHEKDK
jgi:hypothetical protein